MAETKVNITPTSTHSETNSNLNLHLHHHEHKTFTIIGDAIWVFKTLKYLNVMLLIIPFAIASKLAGWSPLAIFILNFISIMPLAKVLGLATEELSLRTNQTIGGLLNATFGNAVEMILSIVALSQGEEEVVKSSLLGSILSNLLLVLGFCLMLGKQREKEEERYLIVSYRRVQVQGARAQYNRGSDISFLARSLFPCFDYPCCIRRLPENKG